MFSSAAHFLVESIYGALDIYRADAVDYSFLLVFAKNSSQKTSVDGNFELVTNFEHCSMNNDAAPNFLLNFGFLRTAFN